MAMAAPTAARTRDAVRASPSVRTVPHALWMHSGKSAPGGRPGVMMPSATSRATWYPRGPEAARTMGTRMGRGGMKHGGAQLARFLRHEGGDSLGLKVRESALLQGVYFLLKG